MPVLLGWILFGEILTPFCIAGALITLSLPREPGGHENVSLLTANYFKKNQFPFVFAPQLVKRFCGNSMLL